MANHQQEMNNSAISMQQQEELSICPSFNCYYSANLNKSSNSTESKFTSNNESSSIHGNDDEIDDADFEFTLFRRGVDDQIRPIFPLFNRDRLIIGDREIQLENLFVEDRDCASSSSSSEIDESEVIPEPSPGRCEKSNSTGSSSKWTKRWRFRDLLRRCNSDGKDRFPISTPSSNGDGKDRFPIMTSSPPVSKREGRTPDRRSSDVGKSKAAVSAHEEFYVRNRAMRDGDKRRTYLPYKQDIVKLFACNVGGLSLTKNFPPF